MALSLYGEIRAQYPQAHITIAIPEALRQFPLEGLVDEVRPLDLRERKTFRGMLSLSQWLRREPYDLAFVLPDTFRATLPFFLARVPVRRGFSSMANRWLLTEGKPWPGVEAGTHKSRQYLSLVSSHSQPEKMKTAVVRDKSIVVAAGASISLREWPYYRELCERLRKKFPEHRVQLVGTAGETRLAALASSLAGTGVENLLGKTTLPELLDLTSRAALVIANDSGVAHVAAHAGAPVLALFGPGDPRYVRPLGEKVHIVRNATLTCSPCESSVCRAPHGYQECLRSLTVESVLAEVDSMLGKTIRT